MRKRRPRIALYIVGQWRAAAFRTIEYNRRIWETFDCDVDVFIHVWDFAEGKNTWPNHGFKTKNNSNVILWDINSYKHSSDDIEIIKNNFENIKYFQVEDIKKNREIQMIGGELTNLSAFPQWYCAYKCNEYRKLHENMTGVRYDIVFKLRPDVIVEEESINYFHTIFNRVLLNPKRIYSKYHNTIEKMKNDKPWNVVWDYFTVSSTFGSDCLMNWVKDSMDGKEVYSTDYIIDNELIPNDYMEDNTSAMHPSPIGPPPNVTIVREIFKYFDLNYFFKKEYHSMHSTKSIWQPSLANSLNKIMYCSGEPLPEEFELFYSLYNFNEFISNLFKLYEINTTENYVVIPTEEQLRIIADYLLSKQDEYELKLKEIYEKRITNTSL